MVLTLDLGNTTMHGGIFDGDRLLFQFRRTSDTRASSDEVGVFLRNVIRENGADPSSIRHIAICSVVPDAIHSIKNACQKYFGISPFLLQAGVKTGLKIKYRNPLEVGADRIADAIAGVHLYPNRNLLIVDFGTATTIEVITRDREYLGGAILAGMRISMEALDARTARLPTVEIVKIDPKQVLGRSTVESIQSGLYFGTMGMVKELTNRLTAECFNGGQGEDRPVILATGGFSSLFDKTGLFDEIVPDLVLKGLNLALRMNM